MAQLQSWTKGITPKHYADLFISNDILVLDECPLSRRIAQEPAIDVTKKLNQIQHVLVVASRSDIFAIAFTHVKLCDSVITHCSGHAMSQTNWCSKLRSIEATQTNLLPRTEYLSDKHILQNDNFPQARKFSLINFCLVIFVVRCFRL